MRLAPLLAAFCLLAVPVAVFAQSFEAKIHTMESVPCPGDTEGCYRVILEKDGETYAIDVTPQDYLAGKDPGFRQGESVVVQSDDIDGQMHYFISDVVRRPVLLILFALFLAAIIALGGKAAIRSLAGMVISFALLLLVLLPAILRGFSPVFTAVVGGMVIMIITLLLSHGPKPKTASALLGITGSLILTGILALIFAAWAGMSGMDEETLFLLADYPNLNTRGILLAGIIIGTLGVLDDVAISQASAVFALRAANPALTAKQLYQRAIRIGQDHIAAAVNTLILAYAGSSLSLLLLLTGIASGESIWIFLNRELISSEILRTLVGSIGLLSAVPLTTWIASVMAVKTPPEQGEQGHHHHHH